MPNFMDVFGPDLTPELAKPIKGLMFAHLGLEIQDFELTWLHGRARSIGSERAVFAPVSGRSYKAVDDLRKALWKSLVALEKVRSIAAEPMEIGRLNIAQDYVSDMSGFSDDAEEDIWLATTPEEVIDRLTADVRLHHRRAERALNSAQRMERGQGRRTKGYDEFITACRQVWNRHRKDKGWSTKAGRGSGPFVIFVCIAQTLLPPPMWKETPEAVGDAVVAALKDTK
jgi:hypothetical protein